MSSNLGVFHWIREAVRRSVLLGFSDAVEQLGVPADGQELHPQLQAMLRQTGNQAVLEDASRAKGEMRTERKRLGRSLEQLRDPAYKPASDAS